jgi:hypothetical protein
MMIFYPRYNPNLTQEQEQEQERLKQRKAAGDCTDDSAKDLMGPALYLHQSQR